MKKLTVAFLVISIVFSLLACSADEPATSNVSGIDDASAEMMEALGITPDDFADMDPDMQQALADEIGAVLENQKTKETEAPQQKAPLTPDDVMAGGNYVVVLGDYMNSITLYYENGVLVKIEEHFQKSLGEEEEYYVYEGEDVANYQFNFIDWANAPLQDILDGMKDYGGFGNHVIYSAD